MLCNSFFFSDKHYSLLVSLLSIESQDRVKSVPRHWKIFWVHPKSVIETYLFCEKSTCVTPDQPRVKQCLKITMKLAKFLQKISKKLKATACSQLSWTCMNSNWCNHYDLKKIWRIFTSRKEGVAVMGNIGTLGRYKVVLSLLLKTWPF